MGVFAWLGSSSGSEHWTANEADPSTFKDARLGRRFAELLRQLSDGLGNSLPFAYQDWAATKAAYRFFANDQVDEADILADYFAATATRFDANQGLERDHFRLLHIRPLRSNWRIRFSRSGTKVGRCGAKPSRLDSSRLTFAYEMREFGEGLFDGIEIGATG
jgi:hypothetical protein